MVHPEEIQVASQKKRNLIIFIEESMIRCSREDEFMVLDCRIDM